MANSRVSFKGQVDERQVSQLLLDLVALESINPYLEGATVGERRVAEYVEQWARQRRFGVQRSAVEEGRFNILVELPGQDPTKRLLLEAHMDTVPVASMSIHPFQNEMKEGKIWGRGACDTKGSLAAMMSALDLLLKFDIAPAVNVLLAATVGEERGHDGIRSLLRNGLRADAGVVGEPTELKVIHCHKGNIRWNIVAHGVAAHASDPSQGVNAIYRMSELITRLEHHYLPTLANKIHPILGQATFNVGKIGGGLQANIVPDQCLIEVERRLLPGDNPEEVWQAIQAILNQVQLEYDDCRLEMHPPAFLEYPLSTPEEAPIVRCAAEACRRVAGASEVIGAPFGTDASDLAEVNIPAVVLGPGSISQAHTADEHIEIDQLVRAAEIYAEICANFPEYSGGGSGMV